MIKQATDLEVRIYPPEAQGVGQFDGGRITEIKPIGFPQDGPPIPNTGPLFYWAWATAKGYGKIGLHPHQGFEIMSYALKGEIGHYDTLGNRSRVRAGGAQVMRTGSGVSHAEETIGDHTEFFQIWFEPHLREAVKRTPTYREFQAGEFPLESHDGITIKHVIGGGSPVSIEADARMQETLIQAGRGLTRALNADRSLAILVMDGKGVLLDEASGSVHDLEPKFFALAYARGRSEISIKAEPGSPLRLAIIEVPAKVDYPLYRGS